MKDKSSDAADTSWPFFAQAETAENSGMDPSLEYPQGVNGLVTREGDDTSDVLEPGSFSSPQELAGLLYLSILYIYLNTHTHTHTHTHIYI